MNKEVIKITSLTKKVSPKAQSVEMELKLTDLVQSIIQLEFGAVEMGSKPYKIWKMVYDYLKCWLAVKAYTSVSPI